MNVAHTDSSIPDVFCHEDYEQIRYVYMHLDNLEYAAERYRHGFASASTTERAVMTFVAHCKEPIFESRVRLQVEGYSPDVHAVVDGVLKNLGTRYPDALVKCDAAGSQPRLSADIHS